MVYDIFTYNGEQKILDLRFNILDPYVDKFVIVEAKTTFSGNRKPLYFGHHEEKFKKWWKKIEYYIIDENYSREEIALAKSSPNTVGARHWKREFLQKESIKKALTKLQDNDLCYIGDVDEIWEPFFYLGEPTKLKLMVYAYWLNHRSNEEFWGTLVSTYGDLKNQCLNHLRTNAQKTNEYYGWHFTSMGGLKEVRRKLDDSYTPESYNTYEVQEKLLERLNNGTDYLGRNFKFEVDEQDWPPHLTKHKFDYLSLCK